MCKRFLSYSIFTIVLFTMFISNSFAADYIKTTSCGGYLLASAGTTKGSYTEIACYGSYDEAKAAMNVSVDDNAFILKGNEVVDAKYALIDYDFSRTRTTTLYSLAIGGSAITYVNPASGYSDDAVFLEYNSTSKRIKIKLSGAVGWIDKVDDDGLLYYEIHPINWVQTPTYYKFIDATINNKTVSTVTHSFTYNMYGGGANTYTIGINTSGISSSDIKYYSYDGNFFYTDFKTMISDYRNGISSNAINATTPYYNYYQYVTFRSETNYSGANLNQYMESKSVYDANNKLYETGSIFINYQNTNGINAALMLGIGINESSMGTSLIALTKSNLFGLGAVDGGASAGAKDYSAIGGVAECIKDFSLEWLSYGYANPFDYRWYGANLGNKKQGANLKYASDPYWAEKAAAAYFALDSYFGLQDYNKYTVAVLNDDYSAINPKKTADINGLNISTASYKYKYKGTPVIVLEEVTVNGTLWYKIMSDAVLSSNQELTGAATNTAKTTYNRSYSYGYVLASYFNKISTSVIPTSEVSVSGPTISSIITSAGYTASNSKLYGLKIGTSIDDLKNRLINAGGSVSVSDGKVATGMTVTITNSEKSEAYQLVVYGDTNGDGEIGAVDYSLVKNYIMNSSGLDGSFKEAADVNKDGMVGAIDYSNIKSYIMGSSNVISN